MNRWLYLFLLLFFSAAHSYSSTLDSLRNVVRATYLVNTKHAEETKLTDINTKNCIRSLRADGSWADIDYSDQSRSLWQLEKHLDRISAIAVYAYYCKGKEQKRAYDAAVKALRYWFSGHFVNSNWWYQKIGIPRRILAIAYQLEDSIPQDLYPLVVETLNVIDSDDYPARPGGDRIQIISNHAKALLWQHDEVRTPHLFAKIEAEAQFGSMEETMYDAAGGQEVRNEHRPAGRGFQSDMTFHHRGDRVDCTITYGMEVPEFYTSWAVMLRDTPWRFSTEHTRFIIDYYLDAVRWHLVNDKFVEPSAFNRELARPGKGEFNRKAITQRLISICDGYREDELRSMTVTGNHPVGCHYFWQSDYFVFKCSTYQSAVRMHSCRNANQEYPHNLEGIKNHFRGDGACHLTVSGREYDQIWPVFNFSMIPGTTSPLLTKMPPINEVQMRKSPIIFSGGITDGQLGACAMDFCSYRNDLKARKSWFFFNEGYVCIGTGISSSLPDTIITTIEQSILPRHGRYTQILNNPLIETEGMRQGSWENVTLDSEYTTAKLSLPIYSLAINHGVHPENACYAYAVSPLSTPEEAIWYKMVAQTDTVHAVTSADETVGFCVFFDPGSIEIMGHCINVEEPCILMLRGGKRYVADPTRKEYQMHITIDGERKEIRIPTWQYAGTTVEF